MIWNEILCLGDSLTSGARDPYGRSYPAELGSMMTSEMNEFYYCHNFSINGETSSDLQKRAWSNISAGKNSKIMIKQETLDPKNTLDDKTSSIFFIKEKGTDGKDKIEFAIEQLDQARLVEEISLKGKHA